MTLHPDKLPLLHGLVDNELDAANATAIEAHLRSCADCRAELDRIRAVRDRLAAPSLRDRAPEGLHARIGAMLDAETGVATPRRRPAPTRLAAHVLNGRWASGALAGALAASLALVVALPQLAHTDTEDQLVQSHVRSLLVDHVVDVRTSDRHVVKPWFNGKIDFAPPVPELADSGFPLMGGRLDYIDDRAAAVIVYRRRLHTINLFVRPAATLSLPGGVAARREGYSLLRWTAGGLEYWAVSDIDPSDLTAFRQSYVAHAVP
jgi:anti-sigma factor RsiW